ncbi:hypothetical protein PP645_003969 [Vibrio vulnificus]|nr:hypothetical protein [Vibrio vulnificus]
MNKTLKLALLPAAVASAMFANSAFAGTEACFETYKGADALPVAGFAAIYGAAACQAEGDRTVAGATTLASTNEGKIAYELTGDLQINFDELDGANTDQHIVYIPTTDIPGGTKIQMELTGAKFFGNSNQIHLVKGNSSDTTFEAVASSDGQVDGESTITFLTKAGITIPAGARLAFSLVSTGADATAVAPIGIKLENTECTDADSNQSVTIKATYAKTDGGTGYNIIGGVSQAQKILDVSPQFYAFQDGSAAEVNVNAESSNDVGTPIVARAEFVYDSANANNQLVAKRYQAVYKTAFYNRGVGANLDRFITLDADDHVETAFTASDEAGVAMRMGLWNSRTAATGALADQVDVQTGTLYGLLNGTTYNTEAVDLFTPATSGDAENNPAVAGPKLGADYNQMFYVLENTDPNSIMNFNYDVKVDHTLDFGTATELDHCAKNVTSHQIGVNGAVLKVPYAYDTSKNWVRITNEHTADAEVTVDVFGETIDGSGTEKQTFTLGKVAAKDSVVYKASDLVAQFKGVYSMDASKLVNRYTFTFTVTAPKDTVHGVSVQAIPGGVDRVMPVLDQNNWAQ